MDLVDEQWAILEPLSPEPLRREDGRGRPWKPAREVLNRILWVMRTGAPWKDPLDEELVTQGIETLAPHRRNRRKPKTQDGRKLRRYKRRWKVERLFAWLANLQRLEVRCEHQLENFLPFVKLRCIIILLQKWLWDDF